MIARRFFNSCNGFSGAVVMVLMLASCGSYGAIG
jgi:hypothetical protein